MNFTSLASLNEKMRIQITTKSEQTVKALRRLYDLQTKDEKQIKDTKWRNAVGFKPQDAKKLSEFAEFHIRNGFLTEKQINFLQTNPRFNIGKYAGQLVRLAIEEGKIRKEGKNYIY